MPNPPVSLEDLICQHLTENPQDNLPVNKVPIVKACMKLAVRSALQLASKLAKTHTVNYSDGHECWHVEEVDEQSILKVEKLFVS